MKSSIKYYFLLLIAIAICMAILASCTPQKRITRICNNHPQLCTYDTIVKDTLITHRSVIDSTFTLNRIDTIVFERYGVKTQIYRHYDTFTIEQTKTDSVYVITTQKSVVVKEKGKIPSWFLFMGGVLILFKLLEFLSLRLKNNQ